MADEKTGGESEVRGGSDMFDGGDAGGDLTGKIDFFGIKKVKSRIARENTDEDDSGDDEDTDAYGAGDDSESEDELEEEGDSEEDSEAEEDDSDDEQEEGKKPKKKILAQDGDRERELNADMVVPTKVNGKTENPTLQQLRDAYSSKASIASEIKAAKEAKAEVTKAKVVAQNRLQKERMEIVEKQQEFGVIAKAAKERDFGTILTEVAHMAGVDPADFWDAFDDTMMPYYAGTETKAGFAQLTNEQRQILRQKRRNEHLQDSQSRHNARIQRQNEMSAQESYKTSLLQGNALTEEEVMEAWEELDRQAREGKLNPQLLAHLQQADYKERFRVAASEAIGIRTRNRISGIVEKNYPTLKTKASEIVKDIEEVMGPKFIAKATDKDIAVLIARVYNQKQSGNSKAARREGSATTSGTRKGSLREKASPRVDEAATDDDDEDDPYAQARGKPTSEVWGSAFRKMR